MSRTISTLCLALSACVLSGCSSQPESLKNEDKLVWITVNVKAAKGRVPPLDSIGLYTPAGEGVVGELPSGSTITTRVLPGTYKVVALPSSSDGGAAKVPAKYQSPTETPWEVTVGATGGSFDLTIE